MYRIYLRFLVLISSGLFFQCEKSSAPHAELSFVTLQTNCFHQSEEGIGASIKVDFTYPRFSGGTAADSLNRLVREILISQAFGDTVNVDIEEAAQALIEEYREAAFDSTAQGQSWEIRIAIAVLYQSPKVWTLRIDEYAYTGGLHGNYAVILYTFDPCDGRQLFLKDFIKEEAEAFLEEIAERKFRETQNIPADAPLSETNFWFENGLFYLTDNFGATEEGLLFIYNPYEIAPYALGMIELKLSWEELRPLLNERF